MADAKKAADDSAAPDATSASTSDKKVMIRLKAAYWPNEDERKEVGEDIEVTRAKARELIKDGKAEISASILDEED